MGTGSHQQLDTTLRKKSYVRICIIGAGNVATHLTAELDKVTDIVQIYSHSIENAVTLANRIGKPDIATDSLDSITREADIYLVSVKDDCIAEVAVNTPDCGIWAHTSGSIDMSVFEGHKTQYGVFYPLQTFSRDATLDISSVPFFIEGNTPTSYDKLFALASLISNVVEPADSARRKSLHIAAVFACNFVNFMWTQADTLLHRDNLDIRFMMPLLKETLNKLNSLPPADAQTGPARRGDINIINNHLSNLSGDARTIYRLLSDMIVKQYNPTINHEQN